MSSYDIYIPSKVDFFGQDNGAKNGSDDHAERAECSHEHGTSDLVHDTLHIVCYSRANHPLFMKFIISFARNGYAFHHVNDLPCRIDRE